jgi:signal transduction histidine kinase
MNACTRLRSVMATVFAVTLTLAVGGSSSAQAQNTTSDPTPIIQFSAAEFAQTGERHHPDAGTVWQSVPLPDSWRMQARDRDRIGWYRLRFSLSKAPRSPQAIYIPRVTNNVAVHMNTVLLGVSGRIDAQELSWNTAQLFFVPPSLLRDGENEILLRLHPDGMARAGISHVEFGDQPQLRERFERRLFVQSTAPMFIAGLLGLTAMLSLALWASRRQETVFGFFGLLCLAMIARLWHTFTRDPDSLGWVLAAPSISWMIAMETYFVLRFCGQYSPRFEKLTVAHAVLSTLWLLFFYSLQAVAGIFLINTVLGIAMLWVLTRGLTRQPRFENLLLLLAVYINFALAIHDLINYQEMIEFDTLYVLPLGGPLLLLSVAVLLIRRFVQVLDQHEAFNAQLVTRVQERERELTLSYERLRTLDAQRTTAEERQRLMRDMHDGIGSHLMSTLALARMGTLSQHDMQETLADCIDELKITIDSLEPVESDLLVVLGNLRYRLEPRLNAAGIELEWAVNDLPPLAYLDPTNTRSILLIVQEAFTNTLKHAKAHRITLSTGVDYANARIWVRVTDDGIGCNDSLSDGRGLENMRNRAAKLSGVVEIVPLKGGGTCVNLYLPLAKIA